MGIVVNATKDITQNGVRDNGIGQAGLKVKENSLHAKVNNLASGITLGDVNLNAGTLALFIAPSSISG